MTVWRSFFTPWSVALFWSALCICSCDTIYPTACITVCNCIFVCFSLLLSVPDTAWALFVSFQLTFLLYLLIQQPAVCRCGLQAPVLRCTIYLLLLSLLPLSGMISGTTHSKKWSHKGGNNMWSSLRPMEDGASQLDVQGSKSEVHSIWLLRRLW